MNEETELTLTSPLERAVMPAPTSALSVLSAAIQGGITKDNVDVVERLVALRREEVREENKSAFARDYFQLRKTMPPIYADKVAKDKGGNPVYTYCSEEEISKMLEPHLFAHNFAMLFGQRQEEGRVVAIVTLIHADGHQEIREYSVRTGATNAMKDATAADSGSTTTAWRHLMIKMFGLKSRIQAEDDARNEGGYITPAQAEELEHRLKMVNGEVARFLKVAEAETFATIRAGKYATLDQMLAKKEAGR